MAEFRIFKDEQAQDCAQPALNDYNIFAAEYRFLSELALIVGPTRIGAANSGGNARRMAMP